MKVCMTTRYFDFRNAGIGRVSSEIANGMEKRGHEVHRISTDGVGLYSYFKYTYFELPTRIPKGYDVYHALTPMEGMWSPSNKTVTTFYDLIPMLHSDKAGSGMGGGGIKTLIGKTVFVNACKRASRAYHIACISEDTRQEVIKYFNVPPERTSVIRLGIRPDLEPKPKKSGPLKVGYLGQLDRRKRVHLLIEAIKSLPKSFNIECLIAGTGLDNESLRSEAESDPRIQFLGRINDDQLPAFYQSLNLFVFPTWVEGYGLPPVEAMACGVPTIVMRDAVIPKEVKSRCLIVDNIAEALVAKPTIDIASNLMFAKQHDWKTCIDQYEKIYNEIKEN